MLYTTLIGFVLLLGAPGLALAGGAYRLTDEEGVTHITNAPTDPRFRAMPGMSGSSTGWLRIPESDRARYANEIREASDRHGVNPTLVEAVIRAESSFNPWAVSRKGARGLMQLMPQTASALGVRNSFDPRQNIDGGVRHLRYLLDRYPGNVALALAAYNAGETAVDYYRGIPPYAETQQYVRRVLGWGAAGGARGVRPVPVIYRSVSPDGTVSYSNTPPQKR